MLKLSYYCIHAVANNNSKFCGRAMQLLVGFRDIRVTKEVLIMKYKGTLLAVENIENAKEFYISVLELEVVMDAGANVQLTGGVFLQTADTWAGFIHKPVSEIVFRNNAAELYFETDNMDGFIEKLESFAGISYVHPVVEHSWGQRAVRFYDLDIILLRLQRILLW